MGPLGSHCFSRSSVPVFLRKHITTCDFRGSGTPGSAHGYNSLYSATVSQYYTGLNIINTIFFSSLLQRSPINMKATVQTVIFTFCLLHVIFLNIEVDAIFVAAAKLLACCKKHHCHPDYQICGPAPGKVPCRCYHLDDWLLRIRKRTGNGKD